MSSFWRTAADTLVSDLRQLFAERLHSVVAYGRAVHGDEQVPLCCLALVSTLTASDLEACAPRAREWKRRRLATPLILTGEEFRRSLDAFPLEFSEILSAHDRVFGPDPFEGIAIAPADLRRACETQVTSHLLHLREGFIECGGHPHAIADLVTSSAPAFAALLRHASRLQGDTQPAEGDLALAGARATGVDERLAREILSLERPPAIPVTDAARLFPQYLDAMERLARTIDAWHE